MVSSKSFLYATFLAATALAAPAVQERGALEARLASVECKNQAFKYYPNDGSKFVTSNTISGAQVSTAFTAAPGTDKNGDKNWGSGYPHIFQNFQGLPFAAACSGKTMLEFPLYQKGVYKADKGKSAQSGPGGFRVIYTAVTATNKAKTYCGVISHDGTAGSAPVKATPKTGKKAAVAAKAGTLGKDNTGNFHVCT